MSRKFRVGILGATGMVGQRFIQLLADHPQFEVTAVAASDRSQGKAYGDACSWRLMGEMPSSVRSMQVQAPAPPLDCDLVFSSLPGDIARETEGSFAAAGYPVISNSSAYRMDEDVPLLIPEVNHPHLGLLSRQRQQNSSGGYIVTNPNCSTIMLALALAPLHAAFSVDATIATTLPGSRRGRWCSNAARTSSRPRRWANMSMPEFPTAGSCSWKRPGIAPI